MGGAACMSITHVHGGFHPRLGHDLLLREAVELVEQQQVAQRVLRAGGCGAGVALLP
jgi:hypothetical protein